MAPCHPRSGRRANHPLGSGDRNLTAQSEAFAEVPVRWLALPVEAATESGIGEFVSRLHDLAGDPPVLDVVHLGLGSDGHTASLVPGDPVLDVVERSVAVTGDYQGVRRMTLTRPALERAGAVVWLIKGHAKADALTKLLANDSSIPAGLLRPSSSLVIADRNAAGPAPTSHPTA